MKNTETSRGDQWNSLDKPIFWQGITKSDGSLIVLSLGTIVSTFIGFNVLYVHCSLIVEVAHGDMRLEGSLKNYSLSNRKFRCFDSDPSERQNCAAVRVVQKSGAARESSI